MAIGLAWCAAEPPRPDWYAPFQPLDDGRELNRVLALGRQAKVFIAHRTGEMGFTSSAFRGTYAPPQNPNIIAPTVNLSVETSLGALVQLMDVKECIRQTPALFRIIDPGAVAAYSQVVRRQWAHVTMEYQLTLFALARLLRPPAVHLAHSPLEGTLVMLNGATPAALEFLREEPGLLRAAHATSPHRWRHFGVVPYGRSLAQALLSEYQLPQDPNRSIVRYARLHDGDLGVPNLSRFTPSGPAGWSTVEALFEGAHRRILVSFVGSAYRPGEPESFLTLARLNPIRNLMRWQAKRNLGGSGTALRPELQLPGDQGLSIHFAAPMTPLPEAEERSFQDWVTFDRQFYRSIYNTSGTTFRRSPCALLLFVKVLLLLQCGCCLQQGWEAWITVW
jgi:hypothetical protein